MKTSTRLAIALLTCAFMGMSVLGCNTFRGAGKDIQQGGKAVEQAADNAQNQNAPMITITATADTDGTISPSGSTSVPDHSSRTYTVRANRGFHVADVRVDGNSMGALSRYTFDNVTINHTITASFAANSYR